MSLLQVVWQVLSTDTESAPGYEVFRAIPQTSVEIRKYGPAVGIRARQLNDGNAFRVLASYIGVSSIPNNYSITTGRPERIAMTSPVTQLFLFFYVYFSTTLL